MKLTTERIIEIKELMKKYINLDETRLKTNDNNNLSQKIWGDLIFKLPYNFSPTPYSLSLTFDDRYIDDEKIVNRFYKSFNVINGLNKKPSRDIVNEIIDHLDFNYLMKIQYIKTIITGLYAVCHSYQMSTLKQYKGDLFGRKEIKNFLKKHQNQFKVVINIAVQGNKNIALVSFAEKEYLPIYTTEYIKLALYLEDAESTTKDLANLSL